jgi:acetyltransferase-like isoleucine patch superfamily enzyme
MGMVRGTLTPDSSFCETSVMTVTPAMTPQQKELTDTKRSGLAAYRRLAVGRASTLYFALYEVVQLLFGNLPGLLGFASRAVAYPLLFKKCGRRPALGRGVLVRIPQQIALGDGVLIDDGASLDVRGDDASIVISDRVSIGRLTTIAAKGGHITLGNGCNIGSYCRIATQSRIDIGESVLIGAYCYVGPGNHTGGGEDAPLISQPMEIKGGVSIGAHAWLGARVTILDGVKIGEHAVVGAHSFVKEDVPAYAVVVGTPAKTVGSRKPHEVTA